MEDKIEVQPNDHRDEEFLGDLNDAMIKRIGQRVDRTDDNSLIDSADVSLDDQEREQIYSQAQQQVNDVITTLTCVQSDLAGVLTRDISHELANGKEIYTGVLATHAGAAIDNYNAVTKAINSLKSAFKLK